MLKDKSFLVAFTVFSSAVMMVLLSLVLGSLGFGRDLAFYVIATIIVASAMGVVAIPNLVYSGFLLVLTFISIAGIYLLLNADFLAAAQILINGGAVTIMLIFAIMLTNKNTDTANVPYSGTYRYVSFVFIGLGLFLVLFLRTTGITFARVAAFPFINISQTPVNWPVGTPVAVNTTEQIGQMFFGQYLIPFEIASIILLMALIGAIVLALRATDIKAGVVEVDYKPEPVDVYETTKAEVLPEAK
jgi:NAD(P)H-quinone oxidoreductase subunit 6